MNETISNWQDLQLFLSVARAKGLAGASELTGKSAPTLGRRMLALELSTGMSLFHRHSHGYTLTDEGKGLMQTALSMESAFASIHKESQQAALRLVKISAGSWMTKAMCQNIDELVKPKDSIRLMFINSELPLNINHRETIIGIRNQRPVSEALATRKIGRVTFAGYARSSNVIPWIPVSGNTPSSRWLREQDTNKTPVEVTAPTNALDLALQGVGRIILPTFIGDKTSKIQRVTNVIAALSHDQWLVVHQDDRKRKEVRSIIDRVYKFAKTLHVAS